MMTLSRLSVGGQRKVCTHGEKITLGDLFKLLSN